MQDRNPVKDVANHKSFLKITKYKNKKDYESKKSYEVLESEGNVFLNQGINYLWTRMASNTPTAFNNANSYIGVGDDDTAEDPTQTELQGTFAVKGMDATYPQYGSNQKIIFKATFQGTEANFDWKEFCVANYDFSVSGLTGTIFNRKVQDRGTKFSGEVWEIELALVIV